MPSMFQNLAALLLAALPLISIAAPTSCNVNEQVVWNCEAKGKLYEVCMSKDLSSTSGHIQYKVLNGHRSEFVFPSDVAQSKMKFKYELMTNFGILSFRNQSYTYELVDSVAGYPGIRILKNDSLISEVSCTNGSSSLGNNDVLRRLEAAGISR